MRLQKRFVWIAAIGFFIAIALALLVPLVRMEQQKQAISEAGAMPCADSAFCADLTTAAYKFNSVTNPYPVAEVLEKLSLIPIWQLVMRDIDISRSNAELRVLPQFEDLRYVTISYTDLRRPGVVYLSQVVNLTTLDMTNCTHIHDDDFDPLSAASHLEVLVLRMTGITDASIPLLIGLRKLKRVDLSYTKVTAEGIARLRRERPELEISR